MQRVPPDPPIASASLNIGYEVSSDLPRPPPSSTNPWVAVFLQPVPLCTAIATLPVLIALIVLETVTSGPAQRPFVVYDATISYAQNSSTIPYWAAWLLPGIVLLAAAIALELINQTSSKRGAWALLWHMTVDAVAGLIVVNLLTSVGKDVVGYLRPDYLARCQPPGNDASMVSTTLQWGDTVVSPTCSQQGSSVLEGARSFPSGVCIHVPTVSG